MKDEPQSTALFGDLKWLSAFQSDLAKLAGLGVVCATLVAIFCLPRPARVWADDRRDRRDHERKVAELAAKIDDRLAQRRAERLKLDD